MAVETIDTITIPGFKDYALYSLQYSPGVSGNYGSVDVEFLNKTGVYDVEALDLSLSQNSFFEIKIKTADGANNSLGLFTIAGYEISKTGQFKVLKVKFADKSVELDRYLVCLRGQVGYDSSSLTQLPSLERQTILGVSPTNSRLIWVGDSDEACNEAALDQAKDPCNPCDSNSPDVTISCAEYYLKNKRNYTYTFSSLLAALNSSSIGLSFSTSIDYNESKFDHFGTVREVLNNISSEIGLSFFYDPILNKINFIDIRNGISINVKRINDADKKNKIIEESLSKSREGSKDVFGVSSFQRAGEERIYACDLKVCKKLKLQPLVLDDLLVTPAHFTNDPIITSNLFDRLEFYSVLTGRVSREFRDMFLWYQEYKFNGPDDLEPHIGEKLSALNGMTVKKVFHNGSSDSQSKYIYRLLLSLDSARDIDGIRRSAITNKSYYFLAEIDEGEDEKIHTLENSICNSFLGQYWMRKYKQHWTGISYSTISPDGSVNYYDFKNPINLPFADIITEAGGVLANSEIFNRVSDDSFYFMSRPAVFSPDSMLPNIRKNIEENIQNHLFSEVSIPNDLKNKFGELTGLGDYDSKRYKVYQVSKSLDSSAGVGLSIGSAIHPEEAPNVIIPINACEKYTSYGLESAVSKKFNVSFKNVNFSLLMPPQSDSGGDNSGYIVLIQRTSDDKNVELAKLEAFSYGSAPSLNSSSFNSEINSYNASTNDVELLSRIGGVKYCQINESKIMGMISGVTGLINYSLGNTEERTYKIEGSPYDVYNAGDGLVSFSMSLGSSGVTTSLNFSNTFAFKLTPDLFLKRLKYYNLKGEAFPLGQIPQSGGGDLSFVT